MSEPVKWHRFSVASQIELPFFNEKGFTEEMVPCTIWGRWNERTGTLWIETLVCSSAPYSNIRLTREQRKRFYDELLQEINVRYF